MPWPLEVGRSGLGVGAVGGDELAVLVTVVAVLVYCWVLLFLVVMVVVRVGVVVVAVAVGDSGRSWRRFRCCFSVRVVSGGSKPTANTSTNDGYHETKEDGLQPRKPTQILRGTIVNRTKYCW